MPMRHGKKLTGALVAVVLAAFLSTASPATAAQATTVIRTAVVVVNYTDEDAQVDDAVKTSLTNMMFGASNSVNAFYREASDGAVAFEPLTGQPSVLGPWDIPMSGTCTNHLGPLATHTKNALTAHGITESQYQRVSIIFPNHRLDCGTANGQMPGNITWIPDTFLNGPSAITHEHGHNFGFDHVETIRCTAGTLTNCATVTDYGDATVMGGGGYDSALTAPELMHMGWLPTATIQQVGSGTGTYTLKPLHATAATAGTRALVLDTGTSGVQLVVAFRKNGTTIDTGTDEGVQLTRVTNGALKNCDLVDNKPTSWGSKDADLAPGQSIKLPNGHTVKTVTSSATEATVTIS